MFWRLGVTDPGYNKLRAGAAADRRVVEADVGGAARFAAGAEAVAAGLNHSTAGLIARRAADAAAVFGVFALANTNGKIALAAGDAVECATAATETVRQHAAEVLQRATRDFIIAAAMDLAAIRGLFELDRTTRQYAPIGRLRLTDLTGLNAGDGAGKRCHRRRTTLQQGG